MDDMVIEDIVQRPYEVFVKNIVLKVKIFKKGKIFLKTKRKETKKMLGFRPNIVDPGGKFKIFTILSNVCCSNYGW